MKHYKKIILTLVALLAVTTGAWATPNSIVINGTPQVGDKSISLTYHFDPANVPGITSFAPTLKVKCAADNKWDETNLSLHEVSSGTTIISLSNLGEFEAGKTYEVCFAYNNGNWVDEVFQSFVPAGPATFPFPITWDATNKTTGFNLPAGNVFMNVEYYPVAAVATAPAAKSDIKATTDDAIVTAGTVAKIGETENAQGTLMYYAVQSETAPEAPDYDNQGWSDKVPTAADFNQGNVYVWYYVKGADGDAESTFNDGAITKLGETGYVTLAAPPTYAITLKEDTEEADKWAISPAEATKGTTVTATYSGTKKVKSVKAVKKGSASAAIPLTLEAITAGTIMVASPQSGMQYTLNGGAKAAVPTTAIDVAIGDKVAFYGNGTSITVYRGTIIKGGTAEVKVYGNIMSLVDETGFATATTLSAEYTFSSLFRDNAKLIDASGLLLPAETLVKSCYAGMFNGCSSLTAAPELKATTLVDDCYNSMFAYCSSLTATPKLPATTLVNRCYQDMFFNCTNLTVAYVKAAYDSSYNISSMFYGCTDASTSTFYSDDAASWTSAFFKLTNWQKASYPTE